VRIKAGRIAIYQSKALFKGFYSPLQFFHALHNQQKKIQHMNSSTFPSCLDDSRHSRFFSRCPQNIGTWIETQGFHLFPNFGGVKHNIELWCRPFTISISPGSTSLIHEYDAVFKILQKSVA